MKRKQLILAVLPAAVLALGTCAWAGTTLENLGTVEFADEWISNTNLLTK